MTFWSLWTMTTPGTELIINSSSILPQTYLEFPTAWPDSFELYDGAFYSSCLCPTTQFPLSIFHSCKKAELEEPGGEPGSLCGGRDTTVIFIGSFV